MLQHDTKEIDMKFTFHNIGMIPSATLNLNGITVIAGENGTGKSTIEKAISLYFSAMYGLSDFVQEDRIKTTTDTLRSAGGELDLMLKNISGAKRRRHVSEVSKLQAYCAKRIVVNDTSDRSEKENIASCLSDYVQNHASFYGVTHEQLEKSSDYQDWFNKTVLDILNDFQLSDDEIGKLNVSNYVHSFFAGQLIRFGTTDESFIQVEDETGKRQNKMSFVRQAKSARDICSDLQMQIPVSEPVVYIASPNVFDHLSSWSEDEELYREYLMFLLSPAADKRGPARKEFWNREVYNRSSMTAIQQEQNRDRCAEFYQMIESVVGGQLKVTSANRLQFVPEKGNRNVEMANLSTGVKALSVLAYAMENNCINEETVLIFDEPEINLHPKWQLTYAEILVRMQKKMGMKILITTHSPYFCEAIDLYSKKYDSEKDCSYYLTELDSNAEYSAIVKDVTEDNRAIYAKLAEPFRDLESLETNNE